MADDDTVALPVYMRVGDCEEHEVGTISDPDALPDLLRHLADYYADAQQRGESLDTIRETP